VISDIGAKISRSLAKTFCREKMRRNPGFPIVSFTFDDCIKSAIEVGGELLKQHDALGTYYISGGLTGRRENGFQCHSRSDLELLVSQGHELGSHLFNHRKCQDLSARELKEEIKNSIAFLTEFTQVNEGFQFSYPFGSIDLASKKLVSGYFSTARGIDYGVNTKGSDLANLKAISIYSHKTNLTEISTAIAETVRSSGWLIFYTHEVTQNPGKFGTTPEMLKFALQKSQEEGCRILSVSEALREIH